LRAWPFRLDAHAMFVLRLGDFKTLVYDRYSKQWTDWHSKDLEFWRANLGINWAGATRVASVYGSNILVGDDLFGLLWLLDPNLGQDQSPVDGYENENFPRVVMGQVPMSRRDVFPCNEVYLTSDKGQPVYDMAPITLETSDDSGVTFTNQGSVEVVAGDFTQEYVWRSLGQIEAPGRLFKITDDGAITRIDALDMNDGEVDAG